MTFFSIESCLIMFKHFSDPAIKLKKIWCLDIKLLSPVVHYRSHVVQLKKHDFILSVMCGAAVRLSWKRVWPVLKKAVTTSCTPSSRTRLSRSRCPSFQHTPASRPPALMSSPEAWGWSHGGELWSRQDNTLSPPWRSLIECVRASEGADVNDSQHWDSSSPWEQSFTPSHHWEELKHLSQLPHDLPSKHW